MIGRFLNTKTPLKVAGTSLYPAFTSLLDLAELCARPFFSAFFEQGFDVPGDLKLRPKYTTAI